MSDAPPELVAIFRQEVSEGIAVLSRRLIDLETTPPGSTRDEVVRELFRVAHSLKGAASSVGLEQPAHIAHQLETLLDGVRQGRTEPDRKLIDAALAAVDLLVASVSEQAVDSQVSNLVASVQSTPATPPAAPEQTETKKRRSRKRTDADPEAEFAPLPSAKAEAERPQSAPAAETTKSFAAPAPAPTGSASPTAAAPPPQAKPSAALPPESTVRVSTVLIDSVLFRLDELVAVRLRLDYQRRQIEEIQHLVETVANTARVGTAAVVANQSSVAKRLEGVRRDVAEVAHSLSMLTQGLHDDVKEVRMVPVGPFLDPYRRIVRDLAQALGKEVGLDIRGEDVRVDKVLFDLLKDAITHLLRNAVDHGIETPSERIAKGKSPRGQVLLQVEARESQVWMDISDDGRGIDVERIRQVAKERGVMDAERLRELTDRETMNLIFAPGFSTAEKVTEISGRGVGLDVVREQVSRLGGRLEFFSEVGKGSRFTLSLPLSLAASRGLIVTAAEKLYCIPLSAVEEVVSVEPYDIALVQGHWAIQRRQQAMPFVVLSDLLGRRASAKPRARSQAVIISLSERRLGIGVDSVLGQEEMVVKALAAGSPRLPFIAGATGMSDGRLVSVLEPAALVQAAKASIAQSAMGDSTKARTATVLVVDDSITTRAFVSSVLQQAGYNTILAPDGQAALGVVRSQPIDLVVSDVEMPMMDGVSLVRNIRAAPETAGIPVILITSLDGPADRARGAEAGATAYMVKREFDPSAFLALVSDCLSVERGS